MDANQTGEKKKGSLKIQRKRGAEPSTANIGTASTKSGSTKTSASSWSLKAMWKRNTPSYFQKKPSKKMMLDLAVFSAGVFIIYKFGSSMNSTLQGYVPTESQLRQQMAEAQAQMSAQQ